MTDRLQTVKVWDMPTRLFHWGLVLAVVGLVVTGKVAGDWVAWHARLGYAAGSLLLFRLAWGLVGGHWSRFASFVPSPAAAMRYMRQGAADGALGHSPLGALSVYAMLFVFAAQVASGLMSANKDDFAGPLAQFVSNDMVSFFSRYHRKVGQWFVIALVVLHVAAIAYYQLRLGRDLVGPMLHGEQACAPGAAASRDDSGSRLLAFVLVAACAALFGWIASLG